MPSDRGRARKAPESGARRGLFLALVALATDGATLPAQETRDEALRQFTELFQEAVKKSRTGRPTACAEATAMLDKAEGLVPSLPEARQEQARFGIAVRQAQVWQRAGKRAEAAARVEALRARWGGDPQLWKGRYRALALAVLWASVDLEVFLAKVDAKEQAFLLSDEVAGARDELGGALEMLQADLLLLDPKTESRGIDLLQQTWEQFRKRSEANDAWREHCAKRLFAYFFGRREYERCRPWIEDLPPGRKHKPNSKLALEVGDFNLAAEEARKAAQGTDTEDPDPLWWTQVGEPLEMQGKYAEALDAYDRGIAAARHPLDLAAATDGKGDALLGLGKLAEAKACYDKVAQLLEPLLAKQRSAGELSARALSEFAECQKDLGRVAECLGDRDEARRKYRAALDKVEEARAGLPMDVLGDAYLGDDALLALDGLLRVGSGDTWGEVLAIDARRARGLLDWIETPRRGAPWEDLRKQVRAVLVSGGAEVGFERLRKLESERAKLGLVERRPRGSSATLVEDDPQRIAATDPATVFVITWLDHERGVRRAAGRARLYVLQGKEASLFDLGTCGRADRLTRQALDAVVDPASDPWPALREAAAFWLPAPLRTRLAGASRVVLCLDPAHARVPFEAFPLDDARPLGAVVPVERAPSLAIWRRLGARRPQGEARVIVDSVEDDGTGDRLGLPRLAFSEREADAVERALGTGRQRVRGRAATLDGIRAALGAGGVELLHLSAHATLDPRVPTASSLLLADGPAPFSTLADLPLAGTLVVLSACTSAGAAAFAGEGVIGLSWGPLAAGARGVVAANYEVNQQATADLMAVLHHERARGASAAEALSAARARLAAMPNYAHPHYWAGFVAIASEPARKRGLALAELPLWGAAVCAFLASLVWIGRRPRSRRASPSVEGLTPG